MSDAVVITAIPTAFFDDGRLDLDGTGNVIRHAIEGGVDAVFVNGTTAEFPALDRAERAAVTRTALELCGPERVVVHVGAPSGYQAVQFTEDALRAGATRLAAITPHYFPAGYEKVREYFAAIRDAAPAASLYAYLFPDRTGIEIEASDAARLVEELELTGVKISIAGVTYLKQLAELVDGERSLLSGNDGLQRHVQTAGGDGVISGVSSAYPRPFVAAAHRLSSPEPSLAELQDVIDEAVGALGPKITALKLALQMQGIIVSAHCRMALDDPDERELARIRKLVHSMSAAGL